VAVSRRGKRVVEAEFEVALRKASIDGVKLHCEGRADEFVMYEKSPTRERAEVLCAGCPLESLHKEFGEVTKPGWGIHGGVPYAYGRPILPLAVLPAAA
jgi:hypothetical protein